MCYKELIFWEGRERYQHHSLWQENSVYKQTQSFLSHSRWILSLKVAMIKICFEFLKCDRPAIYVMWSNEMMTEATSFMVCTGVQQYLLMAGHLLLLLTAPWTIYVSLDFCAQVFKLKTNYLPHSQLFCSVKLRCMKKGHSILVWQACTMLW